MAVQLDVVAELLAGIDTTAQEAPRAFYDSLCEGLCQLTSMTRAVLILHDETHKQVTPVGSHGLDPDLLGRVEVEEDFEQAPMAYTALKEDRVVVAHGDLASQIPERYARLPGLTTLTCTPVSAAGRWLGVLFADRGGLSFTPCDAEMDAMWTLGKTAALAASVSQGTSAHERSQLLRQRVDLAQEVHERVMQRLFGVSLVLGSDTELGPEERARAAAELQAAVEDLRSVITRPPGNDGEPDDPGLRAELDRLASHFPHPLDVSWEAGAEVPAGAGRLARSVLAESLHNAEKHARPDLVRVHVAAPDGAFSLEVANDGVAGGQLSAPGTGMGLRLAALDALAHGGVVEFGPSGPHEWRVALLLPAGPA